MIECAPPASKEVEKLAWPDPPSGSLSMTVVPSLKSTVPVGVPVEGGITVTVAVKVTDWPKQVGLAEAMSAVVVPGF